MGAPSDWLLCPFDMTQLGFEDFLTLWHYKGFWANFVLYLLRTWNQSFLQGTLIPLVANDSFKGEPLFLIILCYLHNISYFQLKKIEWIPDLRSSVSSQMYLIIVSKLNYFSEWSLLEAALMTCHERQSIVQKIGIVLVFFS